MKALLSIKPEFAKAIFDGKKRFEYRKTIFKKDIKYIQVYVTMPIGKIVGEFEIETILKGNPLKIWKKTQEHSGVKKKFYMQYFQNKETAYAIKIKNILKYDNPICPYSEYHNFVAPQSFKYIQE
ncbi:ASCH domain-containing protein [Campylobacter jejuni]|uniref:ASCH domain-containing protein n=1 Tax=Campylobacter jejuni TaxID=197 RepID=UPI000F800E01|nr:ASCH domain-containing protein [Campylobacter jejuni]MCW1341479.1 ASCH domain-containing protein [Campylobacter jejuni]RTI81568.1 hypothetical protein C3I08_05295 [Campylobacter jejuni]